MPLCVCARNRKKYVWAGIRPTIVVRAFIVWPALVHDLWSRLYSQKYMADLATASATTSTSPETGPYFAASAALATLVCFRTERPELRIMAVAVAGSPACDLTVTLT